MPLLFELLLIALRRITVQSSREIVCRYIRDFGAIARVRLWPIYPGSNGTLGTPSETTIRSQALAAYDWLVRETGKTPISYGLSLGTGVAVSVAAERKVEALVLEMPYTSIYDVARSRSNLIPPIDVLPDNRWRSIDRIAGITVPTLIMHGEQDRLIPVQHAFDLHRTSAAPVKKIEIYPSGTHYNLHQFGAEERVFNFVKTHID